jgi:hypothetical protein
MRPLWLKRAPLCAEGCGILPKPDLQYEPSSKNKILLFFIYLLHHLRT